MPVTEFKAVKSKLRWVLLACFVNCIMIVSAVSLCLSPASTYLASAYHTSILQVNMCGIIFTATYIPMTFASMWLYKQYATDTVLRLACVLMLAGGWVRMLAYEGVFWPVLVGQIIVSLAQPIVYNVITKFVN